jgi:hypothetical protein
LPVEIWQKNTEWSSMILEEIESITLDPDHVFRIVMKPMYGLPKVEKDLILDGYLGIIQMRNHQ